MSNPNLPRQSKDAPAPGDVALVLRANGELEIFDPALQYNERSGELSFGVDESRIVTLAALGSLLSEDALMETATERAMMIMRAHHEAVTKGAN